jgi:hypothetical protein
MRQRNQGIVGGLEYGYSPRMHQVKLLVCNDLRRLLSKQAKREAYVNY